MENLHQPLCTSKCRKVITCECPHINVLSIETPSCLNVETEGRMKWHGDRETEPMENLHLGNRILASAIMKKLKNGHHSVNMHHMKKCQIPTLAKFGSLVFQVSLEIKYWHWPLWKNQKMATIS